MRSHLAKYCAKGSGLLGYRAKRVHSFVHECMVESFHSCVEVSIVDRCMMSSASDHCEVKLLSLNSMQDGPTIGECAEEAHCFSAFCEQTYSLVRSILSSDSVTAASFETCKPSAISITCASTAVTSALHCSCNTSSSASILVFSNYTSASPFSASLALASKSLLADSSFSFSCFVAYAALILAALARARPAVLHEEADDLELEADFIDFTLEADFTLLDAILILANTDLFLPFHFSVIVRV